MAITKPICLSRIAGYPYISKNNYIANIDLGIFYRDAAIAEFIQSSYYQSLLDNPNIENIALLGIETNEESGSAESRALRL